MALLEFRQLTRLNDGYDEQYYRRGVTMSLTLRHRTPPDLDLKLEAINPIPGEKILDVGCGTGNMTNRLHRLGAVVMGIDISGFAIDYARRAYPDVHFERMDALEMSYESEFDKILLDQVLEHFEYADRRRLLTKLHHALKRDGQLIVGVPINDFIHHPSVRKLASFIGIRIDDSHMVNFSYSSLQKELFDAGFRISIVFPMFYFSYIVPLRIPRQVYSKEFARRYLLGGLLARCSKRTL